jgi:hypothetical protein
VIARGEAPRSKKKLGPLARLRSVEAVTDQEKSEHSNPEVRDQPRRYRAMAMGAKISTIAADQISERLMK